MAIVITAALLLDLIGGDPRWLPHPVALIGRCITVAEEAVRRLTSSVMGLRLGGAVLTMLIVSGTFIIYWLLLHLAYYISVYLGLMLSVIVMFQALAVKSLHQHAQQVWVALQNKDLELARQKLSWMVGRNTCNLEEAEISRGAVESVAENSVDGIIAPLFYGFIGGPPLAMAYKAINTLDSMLGYKNGHYRYLGWAAAKLDDLANLLPARLAGFFYLIIAPFTAGGFHNVRRSMIEDAHRHPSPNSGIPEAAVAGALQIRLGGLNYYGDESAYRATMGVGRKKLQQHHITAVLRLMYAVTFLSWLSGTLTLIVIRYI